MHNEKNMMMYSIWFKYSKHRKHFEVFFNLQINVKIITFVLRKHPQSFSLYTYKFRHKFKLFNFSETLERHVLCVHKPIEEERELKMEIDIEDENMTDDVINDSADFQMAETSMPQERDDANGAELKRFLTSPNANNEDTFTKAETPLNIENIQEASLSMIKEEYIYEPESDEQQNIQETDFIALPYFQQVGSGNDLKVEEPETNPDHLGVVKSEPNYEQEPSSSRCHSEQLSALNDISAQLEMMSKRNVNSQALRQFVCLFCSAHLTSAVELKNHLLVFHSSLR